MLDYVEAILLSPEGTDNSVNIQTAVLRIDILARNLIGKHKKGFQQILPTIVKYVDRDVANSSPMTLRTCLGGRLCTRSQLDARLIRLFSRFCQNVSSDY